MYGPKHTVESVTRQFIDGLDDGTYSFVLKLADKKTADRLGVGLTMNFRVALLALLSPLMFIFGCRESANPPQPSASRPASSDQIEPTPNSIREEKPGFKNEFGVYLTHEGVPGLEDGDGVEQRQKLLKGIQLQTQQQHAAADRVFDEVIAAFEKKMTDANVIYVSLANQAELASYREEQPGRTVVWLDYAFGEALHRKTALAVIHRNFPEALKLSKRELSYRPYSATAYTEHGFILNQTGHPTEGLAVYNKALQLSENFESSRGTKATALRGIGFAKIELRDYDGARNALKQSLQIEPNNEIALSELEYIRRIEAKAKKQ